MSDTETAWDLMAKIDYCMFITRTPTGMRGRPMSSIVRKEAGVIYFLTDQTSAKDDEIAENPDVLLAYSNGSSSFVSTSGRAVLSDNRDLVKALWNPGAQAFWPNGPTDPNVIVIIVTPTGAEFWNGPNLLVGGVKMLMATVTGSKPDMGENKRVSF